MVLPNTNEKQAHYLPRGAPNIAPLGKELTPYTFQFLCHDGIIKPIFPACAITQHQQRQSISFPSIIIGNHNHITTPQNVVNEIQALSPIGYLQSCASWKAGLKSQGRCRCGLLYDEQFRNHPSCLLFSFSFCLIIFLFIQPGFK